MDFPNEESLLSFFSPSNLPTILADKELSFEHPEIFIWVADELYEGGITLLVVRNFITAIYSMASQGEEPKENAVNIAASLFVAKYGGSLSMHAMMYYFADYILEYKSDYNKFNMHDLLAKCRVYMQKWCAEYKRRQNEAEMKRKLESPNTGLQSLYSYMYEEYVMQGRDLRESSLFNRAIFTDEVIRELTSGRLLEL